MTGSFRAKSLQATILAVIVLATACNDGGGSAAADKAISDTAATANAAADTSAIVRGSVASISATQLVIQSDTGNVTVNVTTPLQVFDRSTGTLADVTDHSFIGVTTVKQADGSEQASEIHVFPEALRGLGEGSRMMTQNTGGGNNRMTNGAVSESRMTNGDASASRMSNGSVASTNGSKLVVQYAGGTIEVTVPPNTPVTVIKATSKTLAPGDRVTVPAKKNSDGTLSSRMVMLAGR